MVSKQFASSKSQKNAWMDNTLHELWVREIDRQMKAAKRSILLIVDNCTAHDTLNGLFTKALFLPPICASKLQPADQSIAKPYSPLSSNHGATHAALSMKGKQLKASTSKMHCS